MAAATTITNAFKKNKNDQDLRMLGRGMVNTNGTD
jgi:hypothetical protein